MEPIADLVELASLDETPVQPSATSDEFRKEMQSRTRRLAFAPEAWDEGERSTIVEIFDSQASDWTSRSNSVYRGVLADALRRGEVRPGGTCVEIGSGTGIQTPTLVEHFDRVICCEISLSMIANTPDLGAFLVACDGALLPLRSGSVDAVVCVNAFLFPTEYRRVLAKSATVVFVSTRGEQTPIYLAPSDVIASLNSDVEKSFTATTSRAFGGTWTVARTAAGGAAHDGP